MRYAIYFCPASDTALGRLGDDWLAASMDAPELPGISTERRNALLVKVRRYGWHATIRAPFTPADHVTYDDVRRAVTSVAHACTSFELPLHIHRLAGFLPRGHALLGIRRIDHEHGAGDAPPHRQVKDGLGGGGSYSVIVRIH